MNKIPLYKTFFTGFNPSKGGMSDVQRMNGYLTWRIIYKIWNPVAIIIAIALSPLIILFVGLTFWLGVLGEMLGVTQEEH